jgi:hypothetical protein
MMQCRSLIVRGAHQMPAEFIPSLGFLFAAIVFAALPPPQLSFLALIPLNVAPGIKNTRVNKD